MKTINPQKFLSEAKASFKNGDITHAAELCQQITARYPLNADAHYVLAKIAIRQNDFASAWHALKQAFAGSAAAKVDADACYDLMNALIEAKNFALLEQVSVWLTTVLPRDPYGWDYLAISRIEQQDFDRALEVGKRAVALMPQNAHIQGNVGAALNGLQRFPEAIQALQRAIQLDPGLANAHNNLGNALNGNGQQDEAIASYLKAISLNPQVPFFYSNLAEVYTEQKEYDKAEESYRKAIAIMPDNPIAVPALIDVLTLKGKAKEAIDFAEVEILNQPRNSKIWAAYGNSLQRASKPDKALDAYMQALALEADPQSKFSRKIYSSLLFVLNYHPDLPAEVIYGGYEEFEQRFGAPFRNEWKPFSNQRDPGKKLKVGIVSQAFYNQVCRYFLLPMMEHLDRGNIEVFAYSDPPMEDVVTEKYKACTDYWRVTNHMSDAELATQIRNDGIDILIDIGGHSTDNRLGVFARKPAPVSLHWLDFGYTTGLKAIDYYVTDQYSVTDHCDHLFSEKIWRLNGPTIVYRPDLGVPEMSEPPCLKDGIVTFGSLSRANRINHKVIKVWAAILDAMPNSRLVLNSGDFHDPGIQDEMAKRFEAYGIERSRLDIGYASPSWVPLQKIDISLDCFPHNSGTTLIESLYMGIPYITLVDRPSVGRLGASILHAAGFPEWIAETEMEYAQKALILAHDIERLVHYRQTMRQTMRESLLMNEPAFGQSFDHALRQMWLRYCEDNQV
ncbi:tetratricopeptide repeat protein [Undibacterium rugosum]|uniref:protein O-GlcNAc transferase n=3 Tax=Undibacterium TaxID=401469 RepID=A0A923I0R3_9BURK|nr:tetratricopeptide repeat protein [Undibacterium rugosum]MBC3934907.1 tetratricopeptide repeat protein [Undibacterium rugosum]MBR7778232.1 tetratricopeptide repeat protein [Undibacterium rugosum]